MMVRSSYTAVVERNRVFSGQLTTEPYECGWASEALFFLHLLQVEGYATGTRLHVQVSPDGMHWCDEGSALIIPEPDAEHSVLSFCRVRHFGNWLRLSGALPADVRLKATITLVLKE
jgi:hypothetical protein